jgi:hypothetical protein
MKENAVIVGFKSNIVLKGITKSGWETQPLSLCG